MISGFIYYYIGLRLCLIILFLISASGAIIYLTVSTTNSIVIACFVLIAKFGVGGTFNIVYIANSHLYPAVLVTSVFGICNLLARCATIASPLVAEMDKVYSMLIFTFLAIIAAFLSAFIVVPKKL